MIAGTLKKQARRRNRHLEQPISCLEVRRIPGDATVAGRKKANGRLAGASRKKFLSYLEKAKAEIAALGLAPEKVEIMKRYGLLAVDNVTGFHEARAGQARFETLKDAILHVTETCETAFYVEMDLKNLGGLNAALGHTRTNEIFGKIAGIIQIILSMAGEDSVFFRHGGDEMSAIIVASNQCRLHTAIRKITQAVKELAKQFGLHELQHPKHPYDPQFFGIGVHFGVVEIRAEHASNPKAVFQEADVKLEMNKMAPGSHTNQIR